MTDDEVMAAAERADLATAAPWEADGAEIYGSWDAGRCWVAESCRWQDPDGSNTDATFIAHARTDVPLLAAEVLRLRQIIAALVEAGE